MATRRKTRSGPVMRLLSAVQEDHLKARIHDAYREAQGAINYTPHDKRSERYREAMRVVEEGDAAEEARILRSNQQRQSDITELESKLLFGKPEEALAAVEAYEAQCKAVAQARDAGHAATNELRGIVQDGGPGRTGVAPLVNNETLRETINSLRSMLCNPEGVVIIDGSEGDRKELQYAIDSLDEALSWSEQYTHPPVGTDATWGIPTGQEPKYGVCRSTGRLINRATGIAIPDDEPVFILRAKDLFAAPAISRYAQELNSREHMVAVGARYDQFCRFAAKFPGRMKEPDTQVHQPPTQAPVDPDNTTNTQE